MAYNEHDDEYGFHGNATQPLRLRLRNYEGPYDPAALMRARDELLYHVARTQNTAAWRRIRMVTPVNINGIRDDNDGFGETSNIYSHAELPENEEFEEPDQGQQIDNDNLIPISRTVNTQQEPTATVTRVECMEEIKKVDDVDNNVDDDLHESGEKTASKEMDTITIDSSESDSDCIIVEENDLKIDEQTETRNESIKQHDASDGLNHEEIEKGDIEKDSKSESKNDDDHESDENIVSKEMETIAIETSKNETEASEEQNTESNTEDKVVSKCEIEVAKKEILPISVSCSESILKCDHCEIRCNDGKSMRKHLDDAMHYSASKYNVDDVGELILVKKVVVRNLKAKYKTIVMKCPIDSCPSIFPQIDLCVNHYNDKHWIRGMPKSQYGLIDLVKEEECSISLKPVQCCQCAESFNTVDNLRRHMSTEGHFPFSLIENYNTSFLCQQCEKSFKFFDGLWSHQRTHRNIIDNIFSFRVFQYENVKKFILSTPGRLSHSCSRSTKRKHNQAFSDNEPNVKVTKTMDEMEVSMQTCSETVDSETSSEHDVTANVGDEISVDNEEIYNTMRNAMNRAKSVLSAVRSDSYSQAEKAGGADTLQETLKCDFCSEINSSKEQMITHLNEMCHRSASCVLIDDNKVVRYMKYLSSVLCTGDQLQKVYAACSENCQDLFYTVRESIRHYILCHSDITELKPCYGIISVADEITFKVSQNKCLICGATFKKLKTLSMHFKAKHYPFCLKHGYETFFSCMYCPRFFHKFNTALSHAVSHSKLAKNGLLELSVLYVDDAVERIELPPKHSSNVDGWKEEIKSTQGRLHSLERVYKEAIHSEEKKKMKKTIRALKESLFQKLC